MIALGPGSAPLVQIAGSRGWALLESGGGDWARRRSPLSLPGGFDGLPPERLEMILYRLERFARAALICQSAHGWPSWGTWQPGAKAK